MAKKGITVVIPEGDREANVDKYINRLYNQVAKNGIPGKLKERRNGHMTRNQKRKAAKKAAIRKNKQKKAA